MELIQSMLPRHMEIIYRINSLFLEEVADAFPGNDWRVRRMSIIEEHPEQAVRMAYRATVGSSKVNGLPNCTANCCASGSCPTSPSCIPTASPTSPTGSPPPVPEVGQPGTVGAHQLQDRPGLGDRPRQAA